MRNFYREIKSFFAFTLGEGGGEERADERGYKQFGIRNAKFGIN